MEGVISERSFDCSITFRIALADEKEELCCNFCWWWLEDFLGIETGTI